MTNKPVMKFIATTKAKLDTIPIKGGQLIFVADDRAIYLDISDEQRTVYQTIITVVDEQARQGIVSPINGFYYVRKDNKLYSYFDGEWEQLVGEGSNVVFVSALPVTGQPNILYILNNEIYGWNDVDNEYYSIGGGKADIEWENYKL